MRLRLERAGLATKEDNSVSKATEADLAKQFGTGAFDNDAFMELNYYKVLGVEHLGFSADNESIKRGYHKMLLVHHPDKTGKGETDPVFLRIQDAFNTLMDLSKRRAYDSKCDFDESIPAVRVHFAVVKSNHTYCAFVTPTPTPTPLLQRLNLYYAAVDIFRTINSVERKRTATPIQKMRNGSTLITAQCLHGTPGLQM
jgi:hypothetical protein